MGAPPDPPPGGGGPTERGEAPPLPRELVLASAGSGKTFRISSRIVGLLAAGAPPDELLASTFTRKAAGEILDRVLVRLARAGLDPRAAEDLAEDASLPGSPGGASRLRRPEAVLGLLEEVVGSLHRMSVGTLDSFFVRAARSFSLELGLPPTWTIADDPTSRRLRSEALEEVLARGDAGERVELVRILARGAATRRVHDRLLDEVGALRRVLREIDPAVGEAAWRPFDGPGAPGSGAGPSEPDGGDAGTGADGWEQIARALDAVEPPARSDGAPDSRWAGALEAAVAAARAGDWETLFSSGLGGKHLAGKDAYHSKPFPPGLEEVLSRARRRAREELIAQLGAQARAMRRLAVHFDGVLRRRQREEGAYRFRDLTHLLAEPGGDGGTGAVAARPDLHYRLDREARHLLLDEFQDTSLPQWEALRPIADELLSGHRAERAAVIVADPKQSIYGWRGAVPELVHRIGARYALEPTTLPLSWRSSQVVLDAVNAVFRDLESNPVVAADPVDAGVAAEWSRDFEAHEAARELPGHVRVVAGPADAGQGDDRPRLMARAASLVRDLREEAPGASIGVLTRRNAAVARLIHELRGLGVEASEEGGTSLTDSPAVAALLALLRLADHPGDTLARYHVAECPLGPVVGLEEHRDGRDDARARAVALRVRERLVRDGYGETLGGWVRELAPDCDRRELRRLAQLVELAFRWDGRATLRPGDFVRFVESEGMEDPSAAEVRVMTVHQAKGLEFDVVVLPELDLPLRRGGGGGVVLPERRPETGRVVRVFPYVRKDHRPLVPEVEEAVRQERASGFRDALGLLYVAMTRARFALHVVVAGDGERPGNARTPARILRTALGIDEAPEGEVLWERGDAGWYDALGEGERPGSPEGEVPAEVEPPRVALRGEGERRRRGLSHRTPSEMEGGGAVDLRRLLSLGGGEARARGTLIHAWLEEVAWLDGPEGGLPGPGELRRIADRVDAGLSREAVDALAVRFRRWLSAEEIRGLLTRGSYPEGVRVETEVPFARRAGDEIVRGVVDRLVLLPGEREGPAAEVVDFKTDRLEPDDVPALDERVRHYAPQLAAYREAMAEMRGIDPRRVRGRLAFLEAGVVRDLPDLQESVHGDEER